MKSIGYGSCDFAQDDLRVGTTTHRMTSRGNGYAQKDDEG